MNKWVCFGAGSSNNSKALQTLIHPLLYNTGFYVAEENEEEEEEEEEEDGGGWFFMNTIQYNTIQYNTIQYNTIQTRILL